MSDLNLGPPEDHGPQTKNWERFFDYMTAVPQERDENQRLAATAVGMTAVF